MQIIIQIGLAVVTNSPSNEAPINSTYWQTHGALRGGEGGEESGRVKLAAHTQVRYRITRLSVEGKEHRLDIDKKFPAKTRFRPPIYDRR